MITEDLLKPRFKVIADYPNSDYEVGIIIDTSQHYLYRSGKVVGQSIKKVDFFRQYPHLFKELQWYEDRDVSEMPMYLKQTLSNGKTTFHKIIKWDGLYGLEGQGYSCNLLLWAKNFNYQPATEEEFLNSQGLSTI